MTEKTTTEKVTHHVKRLPTWAKVLLGVGGGGAVAYGGYRVGRRAGLWGHHHGEPIYEIGEHLPAAVALPPVSHPSHPAKVALVLIDREHPRPPGSVYVITSPDGLYEVSYRVDHDGFTGRRFKMVPILAAHSRAHFAPHPAGHTVPARHAPFDAATEPPEPHAPAPHAEHIDPHPATHSEAPSHDASPAGHVTALAKAGTDALGALATGGPTIPPHPTDAIKVAVPAFDAAKSALATGDGGINPIAGLLGTGA